MKDVNVANFTRAESDVAIQKMYSIVGLSTWFHNRVSTPIDQQKVILMNRDTLYSSAVLDLSDRRPWSCQRRADAIKACTSSTRTTTVLPRLHLVATN